jgi:hypothetical protein
MVGRTVFDEMESVIKDRINTFKHFLAYKGRVDGE